MTTDAEPRLLDESQDEPIVERLTIIGAGLLGSSVARAARRTNAAKHITMIDESADVVEEARRLELGDAITQEIQMGVSRADLVILCVPVGVFGIVGEAIAPALKEGAIVSDVGSVKTSIMAQLGATLPDHVHLVPAHPVAGTEKSGPGNGFASLFLNRWCILTPREDTDADAIDTVDTFWQRLGSNTTRMTPEHHDRVLAITSHLPHLIAYSIVGTADDLENVTESEVITFSAGGFRDFTRIAASDPTMWRDVFLHNREAVLDMLGRFTEDLTALQRAIRDGKGEVLHEHFSHTRDVRRSIIESGQDVDAPDFGRTQLQRQRNSIS